MSTLAGNDRESLFQAVSILNRLAVGWRPGKAELFDARYLEHWAIMPGSEGQPYQIIGMIWSFPVRRTIASRTIAIGPVLAIDHKAHWARVWGEWMSIGDSVAGAPDFDPADVAQVGAAWLLSELQALPIH